MENIVIILGCTASGKTSFAIEYAKEHNAEIISADSMQVYKGMDIGTAKPSLNDRAGILHYLVDIRNPDEEWTLSDFIRETQIAIITIQNKGKIPVIAGGTGLYLRALVNGFSLPIIKADREIREKLEKEDSARLHEKLLAIDPTAAEKIHPNDKKRIIRALEVYELTGSPISKLQKKGAGIIGSNFQIIGLNLPREKLYSRIEARVDNMLKAGLVDEVKTLLEKGYSKNLPSLLALGYKEVIDFLDDKYSFEEMAVLLKKKTRHFARRQMTWFRRFDRVSWITVS